MAKHKYYAVARGRKTGIYERWFGPDGAEPQINGYPGAIYKGFSSLMEAEDWLRGKRQKDADKREAGGKDKILKPSRRLSTKPSAEPDQPHDSFFNDGDIVIYTDGGCIGNPGPGGWGVVIIRGATREELSGGFRRTTNNRMELTACIEGLERAPEGSSIAVFTDSQYVVNGMEKGWAKQWQRNAWHRNGTEKAENSDLWARLLGICEAKRVKFVWVRGHAGTDENERCDVLAKEMAARKDLPPDPGFDSR